MKRLITLEVDDSRTAADDGGVAFVQQGTLLNLLVGRVEHEGQRTTVPGKLHRFGITLISDEQVD